MSSLINNISWKELFSDEDAAQNFKTLAAMFFDCNFSTTTKSEIELLMFNFYMNALIKQNTNPETGMLDYDKCSDYLIANNLGITQERVRTLKIKKQARYKIDFDWRKSLAALKDRIRYDEVKRKIIIPIPDPNLYNEIRYAIEKNGGYVEIQRKENFIQIRPEYYFMLILDDLSDAEQKKMIKKLVKNLQKLNKDQNIIDSMTKQEMLNHLLGIADNVTDIIANTIENIDSPLAVAIKGLKEFSIRKNY